MSLLEIDIECVSIGFPTHPGRGELREVDVLCSAVGEVV